MSNLDENLSANFKRREFACKCGCGFAEPEGRLVEALQTLRDLLERPIIINSDCRCERHNAEVGGVAGSQHTLGIAADIKVNDLTVKQVAEAAEKIPAFENGGIGTYPSKGFVHVDVRNGRARWKS